MLTYAVVFSVCICDLRTTSIYCA